MSEDTGRKTRQEIMEKALAAVREILWTTLGEAGEQIGCGRGDLLALLIEKGLLLGGFDESQAHRFIALMEQIEGVFATDMETLTVVPGSLDPSLPGLSRLEVGRLALRVRGEHWVAYYALPETMEGATELGRVHMELVAIEERRRGFMDLMQEMVGDLIEAKIGARPGWPNPPRPAARDH